MKVEWKDDYKIGHEVIDRQHQHLFELTNALLDAKDVGNLRRAMVLLYKHTREHFDLEEALMRQYRYPGLATHTASHDGLLSSLNEVSGLVGQGLMSRAALMKLMGDWALQHIPHDDAYLAKFLTTSK